MLVSWIVIGAGGFDQRISQIASMRLCVCVFSCVSSMRVNSPSSVKKSNNENDRKKLEFTY